jgi:hypothetical protein
MMKVRDYDHANEHLLKAKELGNSRNPQQVDSMLARLERFKAAAKELKLLEDIQTARSRGTFGDFDKGRKLIAQFEKDFPQTKLKAEFEQEKKRFTEARTRFLSQQVAEQWRRSVQVVAEKKANDGTMALDAARDYAQNKMTDDIVARVAGLMKLDADEVKQLWSVRAKYPVGKRPEHFTYGIGSWVLGDAGIVKGTKMGDAKDKETDATSAGNERDVERYAKALRAAMENRRKAVQAQGAKQEQLTEDDWWRQAERAERTGWLRAFYAESSGQMVVTFATVSPCVSCYGEGTTPEVNGEGKMVRAKCFLCQQTKYVRSFKAY